MILDARYEKVLESGSIRSRAVLVAIGIDGVSVISVDWIEFILVV